MGSGPCKIVGIPDTYTAHNYNTWQITSRQNKLYQTQSTQFGRSQTSKERHSQRHDTDHSGRNGELHTSLSQSEVIQGNSVYVKVVVTAKSFLQDTLLLAVKFPETYTKLCLGCSETLAHNETDFSRCFCNLLSGYSAFISSQLLMKATGGCRNV